MTALQNQHSIFGTDCKMPAQGPQTVLDIEKNCVSTFHHTRVRRPVRRGAR